MDKLSLNRLFIVLLILIPIASIRADVLPAEGIGWIDVSQHGAIPNDEVDDTAVIQQLIRENIDQVRAGSGVRTIYFPEGIYLISDTLRWKNPSNEWVAYLILQGQGREKTILKLKDNTFTDPAQPKAVIFTASSRGGDAQEKADGRGNTAFYNFIKDLTVDTGSGNPGAIGIDFLNSNMGGLRNLRVVSSDPEKIGVAGVSMKRDWPGPAFLKDIEIIGFDYALDFAERATYLTTIEGLDISGQKKAGIRNNAHPLAIHRFNSQNEVPVLKQIDTARLDSAQTVILQGQFTGGDSNAYAIEYEMGLYLRDIEIEGYRETPIRDNNAGIDTGSAWIQEYVSHAPYSSFPSPARSLHLPIEETPVGPSDPVTEWIKVEGTSSPAIQAAIDKANLEGKTTIYFPSGVYLFSEPVYVSGSIRRIVGNGARFIFRPFTSDLRAFVIQDLTGPDVTIENFVTFSTVLSTTDFTWIYDDSETTIALKDILSNSSGRHYLNTKSKKIFIENCAFGNTTFENATVWARQFDPEDLDKTKIINLGSDLWILGLKTEWPSTVLENRNGARTELLGTLFYPPHGSNPRAEGIAILNVESQLSFVGRSHGSANNIQVRDIRDGVTIDYTIRESALAGHPKEGLMTPLYSSWIETIPDEFWSGYPVDSAGWADTAAWLGFINVQHAPWIWSLTLEKFLYIPEDSSWMFLPAK